MAPSRYAWVDRTVLWLTRTLLLAALATTLTVLLAPVTIGGVWLDALTQRTLWSAVVEDLDIGSTLAAPARAVTANVPLEPLRRLDTVLGEERTEQLIRDLERVQDEVALALETAGNETVEQLVSTSVPNFLLGEDLTGRALHNDLSLDVSSVRDELHQSFRSVGHLLIDAGTDAARDAVREELGPEAIRQLQTVDADAVEAQLTNIEQQLTTLSRSLDVVVMSLPVLEYAGVTEGEDDTERLAELTRQVDQLAEQGLAAVRVGRAELESARQEQGTVDWQRVVSKVSDAMIFEIERDAESRAEAFAESFANTLLGDGNFQAPLSVRILLVEQLRPLQAVLSGLVYLASATRVFITAALGCLVLCLLLLAGRLRRVLWWLGWTGLFTGWMVALAGRATRALLESVAAGFGGLGALLGQAGGAVGSLLTWCWNLIAQTFGLQTTTVETILDGWTTTDVTQSATYAALLNAFVTPLQSWSADITRLCAIAIVLSLSITLLELIARRAPPARPGGALSRLQRWGGLRVDDPLWALHPSPPQAAILRPLLIDASVIALLWLATFSLTGGFFLLLVGPTGLEFALTPTLALATSGLLVVVYGGLRLLIGGTSSLYGRLVGERSQPEDGAARGLRLRNALGLLPAVLATGAIGWGMAQTSTLTLSIGVPLLCWVALEGVTLATTGGRQTLSSWLGGARLTAGHDRLPAAERTHAVALLTKVGTVWGLLWGIATLTIGGLGIYALMTGILSLLFWYQHTSGRAETLRERPTAYLRIGAFLSADIVGVLIGLITLEHLNAEPQ